MPEDNSEEVKEVERIEVKPSDDDETVESEEKETPTESSTEEKPDQEEPEQETETEKKEELHGRRIQKEKEPEPVEGETPRERALRKEVERVKGLNRQLRGSELLKNVKEEKIEDKVAPPKNKVLEKYNPQELENLKEVLTVMADDLGFVKKDEFQRDSNQKLASGLLDDFLEKHPMYLPENDKDNVLWNRFKEEFALYKQPANPRDFAKIFGKIHKEIFSGDDESLNKITAQQEKIKSASHSGSSSHSGKSKEDSSPKLRSGRSHMKGFTDEELDDMFEEEE